MQSTLSLSRDRTELDLSAQTCVKTSKMNTHTHVYTGTYTLAKSQEDTMGRITSIIYHQLRV